MKFYAISLLCFLTCLSCTDSPVRDETVKVKNKTVKVDSNTIIKYQYRNKKLFSEEKIMKFEEDQMSRLKEYHSNGNLSKVQYKFNEKPVGNEIIFDRDGKEREVRIIFADGTLFFRMILDANGNVIKSDGIPLHIAHPGNPIKVDDIVRLVYGVVVTENLKSKLQIRIVNPTGREVYNKVFTDFKPDTREAYTKETYFKSAGMYRSFISVELSHVNGNILTKGQVIDTIIVVK
jgi:hypothetical protein